MKPQTVDSYSVLFMINLGHRGTVKPQCCTASQTGNGGRRLSKYLAHLLKPAQGTSYSFEPTVEVSQGSPSVCCTSTTPDTCEQTCFQLIKVSLLVHILCIWQQRPDTVTIVQLNSTHRQSSLQKWGWVLFQVFSHHRTPTYACHNSRPWLTSGRPILHGWTLVM